MNLSDAVMSLLAVILALGIGCGCGFLGWIYGRL